MSPGSMANGQDGREVSGSESGAATTRRGSKSRRRLPAPAACLILGLLCGALTVPGGARETDGDIPDIPDHLFKSNFAPRANELSQLVTPPAEKLVPPPGENSFFPVRGDGQPYVLNVDRTVNLTDALNRFYYDPRWRGEVWTPFDQVSTIERAQRIMATWPEYNEANQYHVLNNVNIFFERYSGFGP
ncbi:MAG TPA: hypothetical protein V6C72_04870 [Chroococcales cyanobacterium]